MNQGYPARNKESISGLIERVTYFNEESGFVVLRVKIKGRRDLLTVVGQSISANAGEWVKAEGVWARDREHGLQFKAERLVCTPPTNIEGIEKYLASGMIKGIGPVYAKKMVTRYGEKIFDIIETASAKLESIDGIGPGRRRKIKDAWQEQKVVRKIMVFLHSNGVSTSRAVRIYKTYGEEAIEKVQNNPYILARDIRGIGFKSADHIAQKLGIPEDSLHRAQAGLNHMLTEASGNGHCGLPEDLLIRQTTELLAVDESIPRNALAQALHAGDVVRDAVGEHDLIFLPALKKAEEYIARRILDLSGQPSSYPDIDFNRAITWVQESNKLQLAASQTEAIRCALENRVVIITGGPGVGKTTIIQSILKILHAKCVTFALCAPTGRAAKRLSESTGHEARTIHRLLEVNPRNGQFKHDEESPLEEKLLVVDECSMVDIPLMHHLLKALPEDGHLLLVGDVDQLPSVGPGSVLKDFIQSGCLSVVRLQEIFRQAAGSRIITNAHRINQGQMPMMEEDALLSDFYFIDREEPERAAATLLQMVRDRIPSKFQVHPILDIQVLCPMNRGSLGVREMNLTLQNALNPLRHGDVVAEKFGWQFRARDKVIQTENNYDKEVFNGDIGQISSIDPIEKEIKVQFEQRKVIYDFGELDELSLAYAITIHKSQGSEFPVVVMPVATQQYMLLQRNLVYTGVTRGRKLVVIVGQKKALGMAVNNSKNASRYSGLLHRLRAGS
ncbi:MAG: ATP-dependent RecD-like DNA helicase [Verrucomicrobia bacterium]|jgi:exodeoxyribonuclease V alpha subunit|nr:ATP-dependent RecD-like DNA helicase [Verrucomicrobiota bacterium]MBT5062422.1 ATP-dependent RecD-like DNA helicase [Verrucomicrobiota bacterium]MBT5479902.1 ATP-dependent RecD-like DNA helicase [Verrucomicrobiota bacterium]MBT6237197.1 ATP-dependent RecD-like DNA helicase [Verrucomicrobiota bacterium]MBT6804369.1 ATP-dependent RecD-like DNA helicase [Verrucomicrobiota bacterium]